jgi:sec-independent protein translocase protein TatA
MPALGAPELIIILVIIVLIFGVGKLPEVGSALGKGIREFRSATDDEKEAEKAREAEAAPPAAVEAPRPAAAAVEGPRPATNGTLDYVVQSGDTLDSVAQRHGVTVEALMQANGYSQRDRVLYPGDKLQVPGTTARAS